MSARFVQTRYQPIFARASAPPPGGRRLRLRNAVPRSTGVPHQAFLGAVPPREWFAVTATVQHSACATCSMPTLPAEPRTARRPQVDCDAGRARAAVRLLAAEISETGLSRAVSVELTGVAEAQQGAAIAALTALHDVGIEIAVLEQGNGPASGLLPDPLSPGVVRIDCGWFRAVARQAQTARLFRALVRAYRSNGAQVLVDGIATETALRVALDSEAELFSGPLLAPPALAGEVFPSAPLAIEDFFAERRVIPLFR